MEARTGGGLEIALAAIEAADAQGSYSRMCNSRTVSSV